MFRIPTIEGLFRAGSFGRLSVVGMRFPGRDPRSVEEGERRGSFFAKSMAPYHARNPAFRAARMVLFETR
jgi:hypothetical protein